MSFEELANESLDYLLEAGKEFALIHEPDEFELLFEGEDTEAGQEREANNATHQANGEGLLTKTINTLKEMISRLVSEIQNFIAHLFASKEQKQKFAQFKQAIAADPNLRNKRVTYTDYQNIQKQYDAMLAEIEQKDKELAAGKNVEIDDTVNRAKALLNGVAKGVATSVSVQALEELAKSDENIAKAIHSALIMDQRILENVESSIGSRAAKRLDSTVSIAAGKRLSLRRLSIAFHRRKLDKAMENGEYLNKVMGDFAKKMASDVDDVLSAKTGAGKAFNALKSQTGRDMLYNKETRSLLAGKDDTSKYVRNTVSGGIHAAQQAAQMAGINAKKEKGFVAKTKQAYNDTVAKKAAEKRSKSFNRTAKLVGIK